MWVRSLGLVDSDEGKMKVKGSLILLCVSAALASFSWPVTTVSAAPPKEGHIGKITSLKLNEVTFSPGDLVTIEVEVENVGVVEGEFRLEVSVSDPSEHKEWGESKELAIPSGITRLYKFFWEIPEIDERTKYTLRVGLVGANDDSVIFDKSETTLDALLPAELWVSHNSLSITGYKPGEAKRSTMAVRNTGEAPLEWEVTEWPGDWLELISPTSESIDDEIIVVEIKRTAPLEVLEGEIVVTSNAGEKTIYVRAVTNDTGSGVVDKLELNQDEYRQGDEVVLDVVVKNSGDLDLEYQLTVEIRRPDGGWIYRNEDIYLELSAKASETVTIRWTTSPTTDIDDYFAVAKLYYRYGRVEGSKGLLYAGNLVEFSLLEGPKLAVSLDSWKFGSIIQGETPRATLKIRNDSDVGTLTWEASSYPGWLEVESGVSSVVLGSSQLHLIVAGTAPVGDHSGVVEIFSNGGKETISVSVSILPATTATPTPTAILTASPTPRATLIPTPTKPPEVRIPVPTPTVTVSATATPVPPSPTLTPSPTPPADSLNRTPTHSPQSRLPTTTTSPVPSTPASLQVVAKAASPEPSQNSPPPEDDAQHNGPQPSAGSCGRPEGHVSTVSGLPDMILLVIPWFVMPIKGRLKRRFLGKTLGRQE